jgi:hypothetical protein
MKVNSKEPLALPGIKTGQFFFVASCIELLPHLS